MMDGGKIVMAKILAINAGSSTLKWKLFSVPEETVIASGMVDRLGLPDSVFTIKKADGSKYSETKDRIDAKEAAAMVLTRLKSDNIVTHLSEITGVGHRVVAGGEDFKDSVVITSQTLKKSKIYLSMRRYIIQRRLIILKYSVIYYQKRLK